MEYPNSSNKQAVISQRSDLFTSLTITSTISTLMNSFFIIDFANVCCRPSNIALTNECLEGTVRPALKCIQATTLAASSTAALDLVLLAAKLPRASV